eukprot:CAMPEP_0174311838 /NCGR_PEP_ID=MMETSP0810-20121108/3944_1 /TAXON_ID=73025 ORGANISM="Eutreptiella gymnastica-like, Strain CCMP1594" /NCGR_SAMPLE_ID=MMETSP0810 /ASSEMBLY_ACC=CAM_ASM_000659 /LENGTH=235 /DNA_ID=CAMNT_0015420139 /DNA_START=88 /DNA_END=796 /DNA_ORIENTATION=-
MRPTVQKPTTRQQLVNNSDPRATLGKRSVEEANVQAGPKMVNVEFNKYVDNTVNAKMKAMQPSAYASDDTALFREITQKFYAKGHNLTGVFNQIARLQPPGVATTAPLQGDTVRITLEQFRYQLQLWGLRFQPGQLRRLVESYEQIPERGLDYTGFSQLVNEISQEDVANNRLLNLWLMERFAATDKNGPLSSTCLLPTEEQALEVARQKSSKAPLYGSACGIDVNYDSTNNGYY